MKKITRLLLVIILAGSLVGCFQNNERSNTVDTTKQASQDSDNKSISANRILITYFSVPETDGEDTVSSASRVATENGVVGNTQYVASLIHRKAVVICIESKQFKAIPKHMIHYWNLLMKNAVKMQDRN